MKKLLLIIFLSLFSCVNAYSNIIILKCVDELQHNTFNLKIDKSKKKVIIGDSKFDLFITENEYEFKNVDNRLTDTFVINRITGGYNGKLYGKVFTLGKCFNEPSLKF